MIGRTIAVTTDTQLIIDNIESVNASESKLSYQAILNKTETVHNNDAIILLCFNNWNIVFYINYKFFRKAL